MFKCAIILLAVVVSSCGSPNHDERAERDRPSEERGLLAAVQSVSLIFPLHYAEGDAPEGYIKVPATGGRPERHDRLMQSIVMCSEGYAWVEKTSETAVVVIPSQDNVIWNGFPGWHPSDQDLIDCISESASQTFFYRKAPSGVDTYRGH